MTTNINTQANPDIALNRAKPVAQLNTDQSGVDINSDKLSQSSAVLDARQVENESNSFKTDPGQETTEDKKPPPEETLDEAVKQLNSYVQSINRNLEFNIDNDSGKTVVKVIDADTEELIRQIPDDEALSIAKQIDEQLDRSSENHGLLLTKIHA